MPGSFYPKQILTAAELNAATAAAPENITVPVAAANVKLVPVAADMVPLLDSEAAGALKKVSVDALKASASTDAGVIPFSLAATYPGGSIGEYTQTVLQAINNIATLRGIAPTARSVWLKGYTTSGDGGGGEFRGVTGAAAGTYVDNGGTIIVPTGGDGSSAWLRVYSGAVNVRWFGAKGDAVTDDTTAIQSAANFISAQKTSLYFGNLTYKISSAITIASSDTWKIVGNNAFLLQSVSNTPIFYLDLSAGNTHTIKISGVSGKWSVQQTTADTLSNFVYVHSTTVGGNTGLYNSIIDDFTTLYGYGGVVLGNECSIWGVNIKNQQHLSCSGPPVKMIPNYAVGMPNNSWENVYINPIAVSPHDNNAYFANQSSFSFDNIEFNRVVGQLLAVTSSKGVSGGVVRLEVCTAPTTALSALFVFDGSYGVSVDAIHVQTTTFPVAANFTPVVGVSGVSQVGEVQIGSIIFDSNTFTAGGAVCMALSERTKVLIGSTNDGTIEPGYPYGNSAFNVMVRERNGKKRASQWAAIGPDPGDANFVMAVNSEDVIYLNTALTANRLVTLPTGQRNASLKFIRSASSTGAFTWSIGGLKLLSTGQWCEVMHNGTAWVLIGFGSL